MSTRKRQQEASSSKTVEAPRLSGFNTRTGDGRLQDKQHQVGAMPICRGTGGGGLAAKGKEITIWALRIARGKDKGVRESRLCQPSRDHVTVPLGCLARSGQALTLAQLGHDGEEVFCAALSSARKWCAAGW